LEINSSSSLILSLIGLFISALPASVFCCTIQSKCLNCFLILKLLHKPVISGLQENQREG
jgi:hypothetical protein